MTIRLRTIQDVRTFSVTVTALVILGSMALQTLLIPYEIAVKIRWPGMLISFIIAAPMSFFIGLRIYESHRLNIHLEQNTKQDLLTGLQSRHAFLDQILHQTRVPGVIIMADIDHFKMLNDGYGHAAGDTALKQVARVFLSMCRVEDRIARYGGEEFIFFLANATGKDGLKVAERLRARLAQTPVVFNDQAIPISCSFGVAVLDHPDAVEEAIARADSALYAAKGQGRNCVKPDVFPDSA
ncbi:MAG: GGDEF domain-containing protein [Pseudomonadota bacterium]